MKKFYWGILAVGFLYGCSSSPTYGPLSTQEEDEVSQPSSPPVPRSDPPISIKVNPAPVLPPEQEPTEVGKAAIEILCKKGYLPPEDC
jgi:hypothetical protein